MEWISVKKNLPEDCTSCLISSDCEVCRNIAVLKDGEWYVVDYDNGGFTIMTDVTHWMPLPEPPKGE